MVFLGAVMILLAMRMSQVFGFVEHHSSLWWAIEVARWIITVGGVGLVLAWVKGVEFELLRHRRKLEDIQREVDWARFELDLRDTGTYGERVSS